MNISRFLWVHPRFGWSRTSPLVGFTFRFSSSASSPPPAVSTRKILHHISSHLSPGSHARLHSSFCRSFSADTGVAKPIAEIESEPSKSVPSSSSSPSSSPFSPPSQGVPLVITDRCRRRLQTVLDPDELLRIGVRGGGCSGFEYEFSVVKRDSVSPDEDLQLEEGRVVVDKESIDYMNGAQLDYEEELIRSGFRVVNNPLAEKGCSCGASFALKF